MLPEYLYYSDCFRANFLKMESISLSLWEQILLIRLWVGWVIYLAPLCCNG